MSQIQLEKPKIMPGIGCLNRRLYIEAILAQKYKSKNSYIDDPCITCTERSTCIKTTVTFSNKTTGAKQQ